MKTNENAIETEVKGSKFIAYYLKHYHLLMVLKVSRLRIMHALEILMQCLIDMVSLLS